MADLSDIQAAQTIKIVGSSSSGVEATPVNSTGTGDLTMTDVINTSAVQTTLTVGTTASAARVGGSNLSNRKMIIIQVLTANMTYGFDVGSQPFTIPNGTTLTLALGANVTLYLRRTTGTGPVVVAELS